MHAYRTVLAFALLGMAMATAFAAKSASLRVGITIVETCDVQTLAYREGQPPDAFRADCPANMPFSVAVGGHPTQQDGRSHPAVVPDDGSRAVPAEQRRRIVTFTF